MRGYPACNFPAFDAVAKVLRAQGHDIISPAEHDRDIGFDPAGCANCDGTELAGFDFHASMRWDIAQIISPDTDAIVLLAGWKRSAGAAIELSVAQAVGLEIFEVVYEDGVAIGIEEWN